MSCLAPPKNASLIRGQDSCPYRTSSDLDLDTTMTEKWKYSDKALQSLSVSEIEDSLKELSGSLNYFAIQLLTANEVNSLENIFAGSAVYASKQASRILSWMKSGEHDIEAIAWSTRCLFETHLILHHILTHPYQEAKDLILKWVEEGNLVIEKTLACLFSESEIEINQLEHELKSYGLPNKPFKLAMNAGLKSEYDAFYRLLCTYTHPSKFLLFGSPRFTRNETVVHLMLIRSCHYLCLICECIAYVVDHAGGSYEAEADEDEAHHQE